MRRPEPRLQSKLLAWLLGPLALLLVLDTGIAYWNSLRFSNLAYDRALHEIGREIVLHVRLDATRPRLDLSQPAAAILLKDPDDLLFYRVADAQGTVLGGDPDLPQPAAAEPGKPCASSGRIFLTVQPVKQRASCSMSVWV